MSAEVETWSQEIREQISSKAKSNCSEIGLIRIEQIQEIEVHNIENQKELEEMSLNFENSMEIWAVEFEKTMEDWSIEMEDWAKELEESLKKGADVPEAPGAQKLPNIK